jgi:solute carrier family 35 (UDP-galactose transporter), member B1
MVMSKGLQLAIGAGGVYASFLTYGKLHEQIFKYESESGVKFEFAIFCQLIEAVVAMIVSGFALRMKGPIFTQSSFYPSSKKLAGALPLVGKTGVCQTLAKSFTSLALVNGLSFPVTTLAKSGKMVPVMIGSIFIGGKSYTLKQYFSVMAIIAGTVIVTMDKKKSGKEDADTLLGILCVMLSLCFDGVVGGIQFDIQNEAKMRGIEIAPFDLMFWTNVFIACTACILCIIPCDCFISQGSEIFLAIAFCRDNPIILRKLLIFGACSAIGQSFVFYVISTFDALTCVTVTTTRKIFSTVLSILTEGHSLSNIGWGGLTVASAGISMEIFEKMENRASSKALSQKM